MQEKIFQILAAKSDNAVKGTSITVIIESVFRYQIYDIHVNCRRPVNEVDSQRASEYIQSQRFYKHFKINIQQILPINLKFWRNLLLFSHL